MTTPKIQERGMITWNAKENVLYNVLILNTVQYDTVGCDVCQKMLAMVTSKSINTKRLIKLFSGHLRDEF